MKFKVNGKTVDTKTTPITLNSLTIAYRDTLFTISGHQADDIATCKNIIMAHYGDRQLEYIYDTTNKQEQDNFRAIFLNRFEQSVQLWESTINSVTKQQTFLDYKSKSTSNGNATNNNTTTGTSNTQVAGHNKTNSTNSNTDTSDAISTNTSNATNTNNSTSHNEQYTVQEKFAMMEQGNFQHNQPITNPESRTISKGGSDSEDKSSSTSTGGGTNKVSGSSNGTGEVIGTNDATTESTQNGTNNTTSTQSNTNTNEGLNQAEFKLIFEYARQVLDLDLVGMVIDNMSDMFSKTIRVEIEREVYNPWDSTF